MRTKADESKFMRVVRAPGRILCKARDLYVRSMTDCSKGMSLPPSQFPSSLPRSMSAASIRSNANEDYAELLRAASVRGLGHINELDMYMKQMMRQQSLVVDQSSNPTKELAKGDQLPKSCSVGMGFMGRIDEDNAYEEAGERVKPDLFPRSKSYAVGKRNGAV